MDTFMIERSRIDELTTLEMALKVYHKDKFLSTKQELLGSECDKEVQTKIWGDYHDYLSVIPRQEWNQQRLRMF